MATLSATCDFIRQHLNIESIGGGYSMANHSLLLTQETLLNNSNYYNNNADWNEVYNSTFNTNVSGSNPHSTTISELEGHPVLETLKFYLLGIIQPTLCCFGIIGNLMNILVLSRKKFKTSLDCSMEVAAVCGLISLALSDTLYCASLLPKTFLNRSATVFGSMNFYMVYHMYGTAIQNIFTQISTWFTVLMASSRYFAICRPLQARYLLETRATIIAILTIMLCCTLLNLPSFWRYTYVELNCPTEDLQLYIVDNGYFVKHQTFKLVFTYLWTVVGFFIPMCILIYCNIHLIGALRESMKLRKQYSTNSKATSTGSHITPTLVAVICQFVILMTPSEVLNFYFFAVSKGAAEGFQFAIVVANIFQTLNFSVNFILYCIVNSRFRSTVCMLAKCGHTHAHPRYGSSMRSSASNTRHTLINIPLCDKP